ILGNAITSIILLTIFFVALSLIFLQPLLKIFGTSAEVLPFATDFLRIILLGSVFSSLAMCLNSFIRVDGQPRIAMFTMIIGAVINCILNPLFIYVFHWGISGAALATIISQFITMVWTLRYFLSSKSRLKIRIKNFIPNPPLIARVMAIGLPSFLMQVANTFVNIIINIRLSQLGGDISISAIGIISSLQMLLIMPILGINQGVQPIIGYNFGAKRLDRVKEALRLAVISATSIAVFGFVIIQAVPKFWISLFNRNPELIHFGVDALRVMLLMLPVIGFQIICSSYFQAIGKTHLATLLTLTRQVIILIPAILILPSIFGIMGVIYSVPLADFLAALLTAYFIIIEIKRHLITTPIIEQPAS
ncbi:MAG: MATE family efflux transporter, partial [Vallitaleaceae bacterium]|nr:MATE family efflux transporter [Vallitaleaceae bacterium]